MQLTRYTDYALRVMIYVALQKGRLCTIREIADAYGISRNHLMKVVQKLAASGYITANRGKSGGLTLARVPGDINIGALIRDTEKTFALVECLGPQNTCTITPVCGLKDAMAEALSAFLAVLDHYTLADFARPRTAKPLLKLLNPET